MCNKYAANKLLDLYPIFYCNSLIMKDTICLLHWDHVYARIKATLIPLSLSLQGRENVKVGMKHKLVAQFDSCP